MEFMSRCNASVFLFITYVLDEWYWMGPNQGYQNFWWILFFQKISNISWINIVGKPKNKKLIYHINSHSWTNENYWVPRQPCHPLF
jgi:hypothetical protein